MRSIIVKKCLQQVHNFTIIKYNNSLLENDKRLKKIGDLNQ